MPAAANRIGNRPQARPSLRLFTRPAWLAEDSAGSRKLVSGEHLPVRCYGGSWGDRWVSLDESHGENQYFYDFGPSSPGWWRNDPTFTAEGCEPWV